MLQHSSTDLGENLAMAGPTLEPQQAADMWYNEIEKYDFKNPGYKSGIGKKSLLISIMLQRTMTLRTKITD